MFAGPNGSGKTTLKNGLHRSAEWFGIYVNPDDLERTIRDTGVLPLDAFDLEFRAEDIREYFLKSDLLRSYDLHSAAKGIDVHPNAIDFRCLQMNSYYASVLADFLRRIALSAGRSFSFETVMSSPDKVALLSEARARGFRTYLYYVATENPQINVERVRRRVAHGGHDVPEEKVISRYHRSLGLLEDAIRNSNRAFLFDSSENESWYFAEITDGLNLELKSDEIPNWFQPILDRF